MKISDCCVLVESIQLTCDSEKMSIVPHVYVTFHQDIIPEATFAVTISINDNYFLIPFSVKNNSTCLEVILWGRFKPV